MGFAESLGTGRRCLALGPVGALVIVAAVLNIKALQIPP